MGELLSTGCYMLPCPAQSVNNCSSED